MAVSAASSVQRNFLLVPLRRRRCVLHHCFLSAAACVVLFIIEKMEKNKQKTANLKQTGDLACVEMRLEVIGTSVLDEREELVS